MIRDAGQVTALLSEARLGRKEALDELIPLVYGELRRLAAHYLQQERADHTLQPTALVHEAFLRLAGQHAGWQDKAHFLGVAAGLMRQLLVDHARRHSAVKRAGLKIVLDDDRLNAGAGFVQPEVVLGMDQLLDQLAVVDPRQGRVVELRYFAGFSVEDTARILGIAPRTVKSDWTLAKAWFRKQLSTHTPS